MEKDKDSKHIKAMKLADKIEDAVKDSSPGENPFKKLKFTKEERELLAEAGIV